ncbi:glycosyltransferase family 4 protein [Winogradskyella ouciana]|uniref:Glycosyltransferase n=1 Tax=Winogradskyella ouciana TaxID=2608631 RepID=A0A7K1GBN7_9FLAO|nr:glycosyltransferase family 4 protein [Winogradskyella ouciana]MTE26541.1 glycosyltransferase [Winogradskyella ouciana]
MKILHCINNPHIGGIERLVIELAIEQKSKGLDVSIMLDTTKGQYYDYLEKQGIPILISGLKGGYDINYTTYQNLKSDFGNFAIVHLHNFSLARCFATLMATSKVVYTMHGLSKGVRQENKVKMFFRESIKKWLLNKVDVLVANSKYTLDLAKQHYKIRSSNSMVILNGIKLPSDVKNKKINEEQLFSIGLVSRFTNRKKIDRLVIAFKKFLEKGGKGKLTLVGDGDTFNQIKDLAISLKLEESVEMVGYQSDVQNYYNMFDVCVFPSQAEPFGLVAVEAYLHGIPVIAFEDSGGLREVVAPLEPENIVKNLEELAERLLFCSINPRYIMDNKRQRIEYAQKNFSVQRMEREYHTVYKSLV